MIRILNHYVPRMAFVVLLMELLVLLAASGAPFALAEVLSMSTLGMYQPDFRLRPRRAVALSLLRIVPALLLAWSLLYLLTRLALISSVRARLLCERVILVGHGALAQECLELAASRHGFHRFRVVGCVAVEGEHGRVRAARLLPAAASLLDLARAHGADEIVVALGERRSGTYPVGPLLECALGGVRVTDAAVLFEREACQIRIDSLQPSYLIFGGGFDQSVLRAGVKRGFDLLASAAIGAATLPVMLRWRCASAWSRAPGARDRLTTCATASSPASPGWRRCATSAAPRWTTPCASCNTICIT